MKIFFVAVHASPAEVSRIARQAEELGYDGLWASEIRHDPFTGLAMASQVTERLSLRTGLAVAFARNPMTTATLANDIQLASEGRFGLGLGTQIKAHIVRRFSMPWQRPVAQLREYVLALRAIWDSYGEENKLYFRGEFYRHTLKAPFFDPGENPYGPPPVLLGGVGPVMTEMAGAGADGFLVHSMSSRLFFDEVTLPALRRGREASGRRWEDFEVNMAPIVATGRTEEEYRAAIAMARRQIAFYTSTPTYSSVLELHGLADVRTELHRLAALGRIDEMPDVIDDHVLGTFAIVGEPKDAAAKIRDRFGDAAATVGFYNPDVTDPAYWIPLIAELRCLCYNCPVPQ
ncbi:MAG: TIGR03617 family F420-dependent LLM class oxidoreductase [Nocardiopsaceae bacterium]|nr:TIGR03617 family F420-dependent LLM class oxidoreductase [Nocardiopsaceae bacterium]